MEKESLQQAASYLHDKIPRPKYKMHQYTQCTRRDVSLSKQYLTIL